MTLRWEPGSVPGKPTRSSVWLFDARDAGRRWVVVFRQGATLYAARSSRPSERDDRFVLTWEYWQIGAKVRRELEEIRDWPNELAQRIAALGRPQTVLRVYCNYIVEDMPSDWAKFPPPDAWGDIERVNVGRSMPL